jgi:hypothetical protein
LVTGDFDPVEREGLAKLLEIRNLGSTSPRTRR